MQACFALGDDFSFNSRLLGLLADGSTASVVVVSVMVGVGVAVDVLRLLLHHKVVETSIRWGAPALKSCMIYIGQMTRLCKCHACGKIARTTDLGSRL